MDPTFLSLTIIIILAALTFATPNTSPETAAEVAGAAVPQPPPPLSFSLSENALADHKPLLDQHAGSKRSRISNTLKAVKRARCETVDESEEEKGDGDGDGEGDDEDEGAYFWERKREMRKDSLAPG